MLKIFRSKKFKKDYKIIQKRNYDLNLLKEVIIILIEEKELLLSYNDHSLIGNYKGYRDLHIKGDWVLIYKIENNTLHLARTGTHSDLNL